MKKPWKELQVGDKFRGNDDELGFNAVVFERLEDPDTGYVSITIEVTRPQLQHMSEDMYEQYTK